MAATAKTARTVALPGEPAPADLISAEGAAQVDTAAEHIPQPDVIEGEAATVEPNAAPEVNAELAALRAQLAEAQDAQQAAEARAAAAARAAQASAPTVATKGSATLTEKGWAVPATYGAPAVKG